MDNAKLLTDLADLNPALHGCTDGDEICVIDAFGRELAIKQLDNGKLLVFVSTYAYAENATDITDIGEADTEAEAVELLRTEYAKAEEAAQQLAAADTDTD